MTLTLKSLFNYQVKETDDAVNVSKLTIFPGVAKVFPEICEKRNGMVMPFGKARLKPAVTITWLGTGTIRVSKAVIFD